MLDVLFNVTLMPEACSEVFGARNYVGAKTPGWCPAALELEKRDTPYPDAWLFLKSSNEVSS